MKTYDYVIISGHDLKQLQTKVLNFLQAHHKESNWNPVGSPVFQTNEEGDWHQALADSFDPEES